MRTNRTGRGRYVGPTLREFQKPSEKKRKHWYLLFGLLFASTESSLNGLVSGLVNGTFTPNQFGAHALGVLYGAHTQAYVYGSGSTGGNLVVADTQAYINQVMKEQAEFLSGFIDQLENNDPRYVKTLEQLYPDLGDEKDILERVAKGEIAEPPPPIIEPVTPSILPLPDKTDEEELYYDEKAIQERMRLYNERVRGTANWGAVDMLAPWEEIKWVLDSNENHCEDCPRLAKGGPYRKNTLPTVPGAGATQCLVNCRCRLELLDGTVIEF